VSSEVNRFYDRHRLPLRALFTAVARVQSTGIQRMPSSGGVMLACNHLCWLDPWLLGVLFPRQLYFMAKEELFKLKPLGWYLQMAGSFPVRRGEADRSAIRYAEELLRRGEVVMMFPEGHRSKTTGAQAARAGAVLLATHTNSPILPVGISGSESLRIKRLPNTLLHLPADRPTVNVSVGEPIYLGSRGRGAGKKQATDLVMRRIVELLPQAYHGVYAEQD
jgi:1-acyl-sn-glycerol-3-phosphate acyltransferase